MGDCRFQRKQKRTFHFDILLAIGIFVLDQISKHIAVVKFSQPVVIIRNFLYIEHVNNGGAAWNLLDGHRHWLSLLGFAILITLLTVRKRFHFHEFPRNYFFALIFGGACGNLWDRLRLGYVIDFIDVHLPFYRWPTFNLADGALCVGLTLLIVHGVATKKHRRPK